MRPLLFVGELTSLQDARSSAAVGFDWVGFSLERGSPRKLSVELIWNMVQWLSGPKVVISLNRASLEELDVAQQRFEVDVISLPLADWGPDLLAYGKELILRTSATELLSTDLSDIPMSGELSLEVHVDSSDILSQLTPWLAHSFIHPASLDLLADWLQSDTPPPKGYALGQEAEEEMGVLDYPRIDDVLELYTDRFGEIDL